jgi:ankyrin repeat protein
MGMEHAKIHSTTDEGVTQLRAASKSGHLEVVKSLYEHGADADIHSTTKDGWTPLCAASSSGNLEGMKFLC